MSDEYLEDFGYLYNLYDLQKYPESFKNPSNLWHMDLFLSVHSRSPQNTTIIETPLLLFMK